MSYVKNSGPQIEGKGKKFTKEDVIKKKIKYLSIKSFIETYNLDLTPEAIGYHMKVNKIDWMQPVRDRFVLLTKNTLNFYKLN